MTIVLASNNAGKIAELKSLLPAGIKLITMTEAGYLKRIEEPFNSFRENAYAKAKALFEFTGLPTLSDDSGICVEALDGKPGVHSARYAGPEASDDANNQKLLRALGNYENRAAYYFAALCFIRPGGLHYFEGRCDGHIGRRPKGNRGFGYDPIFLPEGYEQSFAELSPEIKSRISHRAKALQQFISFLNRLPDSANSST
ncbi:MAG: RdgB/HAM1 family non-canonical purine NTP pyrophosphatase [Bacteroidetes bacterium]|nr:RdgB/HAM1 family non-canonical purine NTP pyrophosphatase [Bacteroidota bacterium]